MRKRLQQFLDNFGLIVSRDVENPLLLEALRPLLLIGVVTYPLFGFAHLAVNPHAVDPLTPRFGFAAFCALAYVLSYTSPWVRTRINTILIGLYYLLTSHFLLLLVWNRFSVDYTIGFFILLFSLSIILVNKRALLCYCGLLLTIVFFACLYVGEEVAHAPLFFTAVAVMCALSLIMLDYRLKTTTSLVRINEQLRQEITERTLVEEKLRDSEARYRLIAEDATDFISTHTLTGQFSYASPACRSLLGYEPEELLGLCCYELFHPEDVPAVKNHYLRLSHAPDEHAFSYRVQRKDGAYIWVETTTKAVRDAATGKIQKFLTVSRDISARKEAERIKDELVSTVSHELRTPLTSLRGFVELMLQKDFSRDKQREFLVIIQNEAIRLTNLVNDFLDLQRMESGRQGYDFHLIHIDTLMREVASTLIPATGLHIVQTHFSDQLPPVIADADRLRQVLSNLISNAVKYSPQGGVITLGACPGNEEVVAWIADEGLGIPETALPQLFTKFFRVDNQDTRSIGGTGLGLSLVKNIVEAHQGRVWVESTLGQGSTFFFSLPLAKQLDLWQEATLL